MLPLVLSAGGLVALVAGFAILRSLGSGYRIGRLLATTPTVTVAEAARMAADGERRYVAIEGRIDSEDEFEDAAHNPLVLRRTRLAAHVRGRWTRFEDGLEAVPFEVRDAVAGVAVDTASLGDGLVVMSRISRGLVRDLGERAPGSLPGDAAALVTIDQVSSVEHARVLGWPSRGPDGRPIMTAGQGRPLVLSTLETGDAMRVLARGERLRPRLAAGAFVLGGILLAGGLLVGALTVGGGFPPGSVAGGGPAPLGGLTGGAGASGSPAGAAAASPVPTSMGGDTRSSGAGPGLVGAPGVAIVAVVALGLASVGATLVYVRVSGGPRAR